MAYLIDSWGQIDSIAEWDAAVAEATGIEVTSSVGTANAIGGAAGTASGIELAAIAEAITAAGIANTQLDGIETSASAGDMSASGKATATVEGTQANSSAATIGANGSIVINGNATVDGIQAQSEIATITANGVVNAEAIVTGVQASATAGSVSANVTDEAAIPAGGKPRRRRPVIHPPNFLFDKPVDAIGRVYGVQAVAALGSVRPIGVSNYELNEGVQGQSEVARISATGIQNPTDEELALLLMA